MPTRPGSENVVLNGRSERICLISSDLDATLTIHATGMSYSDIVTPRLHLLL
ncbi:hypothetical protein ABK675_23020 [Hafnia paralvei]|uniref:hypothetical protein n=1 Tax=Hafnia paralvei TaxID=546367 RepID=UPI00375300D5